MVVMVFLALQRYASTRLDADRSERWRDCASNLTSFLHHIAMLDVFCVGVIIMFLAGDAFRSVGFDLSLLRGMRPLVCAAILEHTTCFLLTHQAVATNPTYNQVKVAASP